MLGNFLKVIFFFSFSLVQDGIACTIENPYLVLTTDPGKTLITTIRYQDCKPEKREKIQLVLSEYQHALNPSHIVQINPSLGEMKFRNNLSKIKTIQEIVEKTLPANFKVVGAKFINGSDTLKIVSPVEYEVICQQCSSPGNRNATIRLTYENGETMSSLVSLAIGKKVEALVATRNINPLMDKTLSGNVESKIVYSLTPEAIIQNTSDLSFYKPARRVKKGSVLKYSDVNKKRLISPGSIVSVSYKVKNLNLSMLARSISNGRLGETIELKNLKSNKRFNARVSGPNRAVVDL